MKTVITFVFLLLHMTAAAQVSFPLSFEADFDWSSRITNFSGGVLTVEDNPLKTGINTSNKSAKMVKNAGDPWGGAVLAMDGTIDMTTLTAFKVKVLSPRADAKLTFKLEAASGAGFEVATAVGTANAWTEMTFDLSAAPKANVYTKLVFIFDNGTPGDGSVNYTFYMDDVLQVAPEGPVLEQVDLPATFDNANVNYSLVDFNGNTSAIVEDPTNASNKVVRVVKSAVAEPWAGTTVGGPAGLKRPIPFTDENRKMSVRVWSPDAGIVVRLKVETAGTPTQSVEAEKSTTKAGEWEMLEFDFNNQATGTAAFNPAFVYNMASIFFNFGTTGATAGEKTYYFDDLMGPGAPPPVGDVVFPVNFENAEFDWSTRITNFSGGVLTVIDNPDKSGINTSNKVASMVKNAGDPWGGATLLMDGPIDMMKSTFKVKVWSPRADAKFTFKLENATNGAEGYEVVNEVGAASVWTEMSFDFSAAPPFNYGRLVFIFDNGTVGDGSANFTFYFDEIVQMESTGPVMEQVDLPVTFDNANVNYGLTDFGGNASSIVENPTQAGNKVAQIIKGMGSETWAGTSIGAAGFKRPVPFTAENRKLTVRVWAPVANTPVRLKLEDSKDATRSVETQVTTTLAGEWEILEFDFNNQAEGTAAFNPEFAYNKASIFFNFGTSGTGEIYYFDDVVFQGTPPPVGNGLPLNFEQPDFDWNAVITNFSGGVLTVIDNPGKSEFNPSDKVAQMVKGAGDPWGGAAISIPGPIKLTETAYFKVKVWSPRAAELTFKLENATNGAQNIEVKQQFSVANEWTELTFDLTNGNPDWDYHKVVLIFDNGTVGDGSANFTFYVDDIQGLRDISTEETRGIPSVLTLAQNYPNPFNPATTIQFGLPAAGKTTLTVVNLLGQTVATLVNGNLPAGEHTVSFDAAKLASGVYLYRLQSGSAVQIKRMTLIK